MSAAEARNFATVLEQVRAQGGADNDDLVAMALPLLGQVLRAHEEGLVAPLRGADNIEADETGLLSLTGGLITPYKNPAGILNFELPENRGVTVLGRLERTTDLDTGGTRIKSLDVVDTGETVTRPMYVPGYTSWELELEHHDALTDIAVLGQILASLATGLNFHDREELERFAGARDNLFQVNRRLHPVIARIIVEMTELHRHQRTQDLESVIRALANYRDVPADQELDFERDTAYRQGAAPQRRRIIQTRLRDRLFDISRRNRLVYFKPSLQTLNLAVASVPVMLDYRNIRPSQLFFWQGEIAGALSSGSALSLGRHLRFEEAPYISGVLDKIISEARRDRAEYGFAQLRLVPVFLRWHNLKEAPNERIVSPLLLLPVELSKKKGVRDSYVLEPVGTEAEVNPALRHHLRELYNLRLPESIDLRETSVEQFHAELEAQIKASEPGVTLRLLDKPRIRLIHERAKQRLDLWRKRQGSRAVAPVRTAYSYSRDNFAPMGLKLLLEKVKPTPSPVRYLGGDGPSGAVAPIMAAPVERETEKEMFALAEEGSNPYTWDFDICSVTLGNFHYRKMTLVRDYASLLDEDVQSASFDAVFSVQPRPRTEELPPLPLAERFTVVPGDATQITALAQARAGGSYTIQGPPGTGKSQTITNLIADYVARGKRVLFVCEKRAAIDVVYHRLGQQNLQELCCLIHDSQTDKKAFVQNLKETYEGWLALPENGDAEARREGLLRRLETELAGLERFSGAMCSGELPLHELVRRTVELGAPLPGDELLERVPQYPVWQEHRETLQWLEATLREAGSARTLAEHPLRHLGMEILRSTRPMETLKTQLDEAEAILDQVEQALEMSALSPDLWDTFEELELLLRFAEGIRALAEIDALGLLQPNSPLSKEFKAAGDEISKLEGALKKAEKAAAAWKTRLSAEDTRAALQQARGFEGSIFRFLNPAFYKLRGIVQQNYDFSAHKVPPTLTAALEMLEAEHTAREAVEAAETAAGERFGTEYGVLQEKVAALRGAPERKQKPVEALTKALVENPSGRAVALELGEVAGPFAELEAKLGGILGPFQRLDFAGVGRELERVRGAVSGLPGMLPVLTELWVAPKELQAAVREVPLSAIEFEAASAWRTLQARYRDDRELGRTGGTAIERAREEIGQGQKRLLGLNSATIRERVQRKFRGNVNLSNAPAAGLTAEEKEFKKGYSAGRRELEHEFGKTMRFKSIRDLAAGASGQVVRDLKPVWLMSPLSVSDTLPLEPDLFDVVIFDEASQIPVEEAVPALHRASQVIVVGDEMQLPPTAFFSTSREEEAVEIEEDGERIEVGLDADSLLTQSGTNLPSTMLAWHYRSRYEALISFSNAAFYRGELYTIPDRSLPSGTRPEILVTGETDIPAHVSATLDRSISFHFMERSPYENRRNTGEATYVAELVREILARETGMTIGIVAFSEAQQGEIERALDALGEQDPAFAALLADEEVREADEQFCGLFVKNLENVQGDERDIIILSVCYGPDTNGKTLMNFGPINQRGGEKRLNVIFSRARHHMAVVSSLRHTAITNDYNDGAAALKNYLQFASCVSTGDLETARRVLEAQNASVRRGGSQGASDPVVGQLAEALRTRGHAVDLGVGQSRFRCDLAIRGDGGQYSLGILVDTAGHYANRDVLERYCTRPGILEAFGWGILLVLGKDWIEGREAVLGRIERVLQEPRGEEITEIVSVEEVGEIVIGDSPVLADGTEETAVVAATQKRRYFELVGGGSAKFWEILVEGNGFTVRFGRIGTKGQVMEKSFEEPALAETEAERLVGEKVRKGYVEKVG